MRVETRLLKAEDNTNGGRWRDLFGPGLINRTMIGILVMFFQREPLRLISCHPTHVL